MISVVRGFETKTTQLKLYILKLHKRWLDCLFKTQQTHECSHHLEWGDGLLHSAFSHIMTGILDAFSEGYSARRTYCMWLLLHDSELINSVQHEQKEKKLKRKIKHLFGDKWYFGSFEEGNHSTLEETNLLPLLHYALTMFPWYDTHVPWALWSTGMWSAWSMKRTAAPRKHTHYGYQ